MGTEKAVYKANADCLKEHHPDVFKKINHPDIMPQGEIVPAGENAFNLRVSGKDGRNYLLHGPSGPLDDTAQFLEMIPEHAAGVIVMMGFGLGIPSLEIIKNRSDLRHLVIFEQDPEIFKQALHVYDLTALFSNPKVVLCLEKKPILDHVFGSAFKALELEDIQILKHNASFQINPAYLKLADKVFSYLNTFSIRGTTTKKMGRKFVRNRFKNLKRIRHDSLVDSIKGIFKDIPAILVAGGPSLDKNIDLLKKVKNRAVLFAVDSVVPTLLKKGIIPDFMAAIDPQKITLEKFKGAILPSKGISLICSAWVAPEVPFHLPAERVIWAYGGRNIELWLNKALGGKNTYIGAGTVAHLNLHAALDMGCNPLIFVGQDLAYTETKDHVANVSLNNSAQMEKILNSKNDWRWVKGIHGGQVKTSRSFFNHIKVFEDLIKKNTTATFVNATEGGAHIEGTQVMSLKDVLEGIPNHDKDFSEIVSKHVLPLGDEVIDELDHQLELFNERGSKIAQIIKTSSSLSSEIKRNIQNLKKKKKTFEDFSSLPPKVQKLIKKVDTLSAKLDQQGIFWHLLDEVTFEGLRQSEKMLHEIGRHAGENSRYLDWILKNIERFEYINEIRKEIISWLGEDVSDVINFHKDEKQIAGKNNGRPQTAKKISQFYFEHGLTSLAIKYLDIDENNDADCLFMRGCCYDFCGDDRAAESFFQKAVELNPDIAAKIDDFKKEQAENYFEFGKKWKEIDPRTSRRLLLKGLRYEQTHSKITDQLINIASSDMDKADRFVKEHELKKALKAINPWIQELDKNPFLKDALGFKITAALYQSSGDISVHDGAHENAYQMYLKAIEASPKDPEHYVRLTDLCFSVGDYDKGVTALNTAVMLDRSNARLWELIGDKMAEGGNWSDALAAYEKCFLEMPENIYLLKKIGDIHRAQGKPEAAHEAYLQYERLEKSKNSEH